MDILSLFKYNLCGGFEMNNQQVDHLLTVMFYLFGFLIVLGLLG